jgi:hypothetical protein
MSIFGKAKKGSKKDRKELPEVIENPMKGYVYRTSPQKVGKVQVGGRMSGDYEGWSTVQELEDRVEQTCGGGTYDVKCFQTVNGQIEYAGNHTFTIPGKPMVDGNRVGGKSDDDDDEDKHKKASTVDRIQEQIEEEEAQARLDEARARRKSRLKEAGLMEDEDDPNPQFQMPAPNQEDPRVAMLTEQLNQMRTEMRIESERRDREAERERHNREIDALKTSQERQIEDLKRLISEKKDNGSGAMAAQMEAIKAVITAGQEQTRAMMQSNSELVKVMLSKDTATPMNERIDRLMEKLIDNRASGGKEQMEIMREAFQTGIQMARGGDAAPTTMADVAKEFGARLMDIVGEYSRSRGNMSEEVITNKIKQASESVAQNVIGRLAPALKAGLPAPQQPGAIPAASAAAQAPAASETEEIPVTPELRAAVDKVIEAFLKDLDSGDQSQTWVRVAKEVIPAEVLASIGPLSYENLTEFAFRYGSPEVVSRAMIALAQLGAETDEEKAVVDQMAQRASTTEHNPSIPSVGPVDIFDQDADEDEEPAAPTQPVEPPKKQQRKTRRKS